MSTYLANPLTLQLRPACANTVYLRWLSPLGTWEGWSFAGVADDKTSVAEATDIATADARYAVAVRRAGVDTLTVRADDLTAAQHQALTTLLDSPQVYRQYPDGSREPVLVADNATTTRSTDGTRFTLEVDIKLPSRNALTH
ncbi:MAG: hypothetical protein ACRYFX_12935 [Janthinobacterium lividum]